MQYEIRTQQGQLLLEEGTFNQLGNNLMLFLKKRVTPTSLEQILVHDTREPGRPVTWYARTGNVSFGQDGTPRLVLHNGLRQAVTDKQIDMLEFETYTLDIHQTLDAKSPLNRQREEEEFNIPELLDMMHNATTPAKYGLYAEQLNKRFLWPLTPLPMVLLAAAWLLRPPRRTQSSSRYVAGAGLSAVAYMGLLSGLSGLAQGGAVWALYAQWLLPVLSGLAAWMIAEKSTFQDPESNTPPLGKALS
jgi:lipopolysaccharide export system permease protein